MIEINGQAFSLQDPVVLAVLVAGIVLLLMLFLLISSVRRAGGHSAQTTDMLVHALTDISTRVEYLPTVRAS